MNAMETSTKDESQKPATGCGGCLIAPEDQVLSTLEADGSRRWLKPKLNIGKLWTRRRLVAYVLMLIFTVMPFIKVGGKPFVLLDIVSRRFTIFGFTFLPTDTVLLAIFLIGVLLSIVLFTALFGRVWCGWACPQTVYMEFLIRPVERLFDGTAGRGGHKKNIPAWRTIGKYIAFFILCVYLANTFLAYFIGVDRLGEWVTRSPLEHPVPFAVMAFATFGMMVDFCYFREQTCILACPYGRLQSVLLDQNSLIVAYDSRRGENRGKLRKQPKNNDSSGKQDSLPVLGDCIDCRKCVTTCPTGIDIRDGLQMECINCTQCIDACNSVMKKIGRAPDLIRYSSQARDEGKTGSLLRARTLIYPILIVGIAIAFLAAFLSTKSFEAIVVREVGNPHSITDTGLVRNNMKLKLTNRTDEEMSFAINLESPKGAAVELRETSFIVPPRQNKTFHISLVAPKDCFQVGRADSRINVTNNEQVTRTLDVTLIGPYE